MINTTIKSNLDERVDFILYFQVTVTGENQGRKSRQEPGGSRDWGRGSTAGMFFMVHSATFSIQLRITYPGWHHSQWAAPPSRKC